MSSTDLTPGSIAANKGQSGPVSGRVAPTWWACVALTCALLIGGGALRWWQERRLEATMIQGADPAFPLATLPEAVGPWRQTNPEKLELEPEVLDMLRCSDYVRRIYVNQQTGVQIEMLVLYGPASIAHRPELCYPGSGFTQVEGPTTRALEVEGAEGVYNSLVFAKGADRQQVIYSFRCDGRWTVDTDSKALLRLPGLYKIQLARRVSEAEKLDGGSPSEGFLNLMFGEIEQRIASASGRPVATTAMNPASGEARSTADR
jgi:EpsI family protein